LLLEIAIKDIAKRATLALARLLRGEVAAQGGVSGRVTPLHSSPTAEPEVDPVLAL